MRVTWRAVLVAAGSACALLQAAVGDREALALAALLLVALGLLWWKGWLAARIAVVLLSLNVVVWMLPAALSNIAHREDLAAVALPVALVVLAVLTAVAAVLARDFVPHRSAGWAAIGAVVLVPAVLVVARLPGVGDGLERRPGDYEVTMRNTRFDPADLTVPAGDLGVVIQNDDLFWHTWTIRELDVEVRVPTGGTRRVDLSALGPGTYAIVCTIPGHEAIGMTGTLDVEGQTS